MDIPAFIDGTKGLDYLLNPNGGTDEGKRSKEWVVEREVAGSLKQNQELRRCKKKGEIVLEKRPSIVKICKHSTAVLRSWLQNPMGLSKLKRELVLLLIGRLSLKILGSIQFLMCS